MIPTRESWPKSSSMGGFKLVGLEEEELGLEEVFLRVTKGETQ